MSLIFGAADSLPTSNVDMRLATEVPNTEGRQERLPDYFLLSVSNRMNLDICIRNSLAGFTNSSTGAWAFCDIRKGDFISFLYGAKVYNLYEVVDKYIVPNFGNNSPWPPITLRESGKTYYFPYRFRLKPIRLFEESLVNPKFAYVSENLLLRAGYRKTHFQADQTTLQNASQMGSPNDKSDGGDWESIIPVDHYFIDRSVGLRDAQCEKMQGIFYISCFSELILQSVLRHKISGRITEFITFLQKNGIRLPEEVKWEVLGEKALSYGYIDLLIKNRTPIGQDHKIILEVKMGRADRRTIEQVIGYSNELGKDLRAKMVICSDASEKVVRDGRQRGIEVLFYRFKIKSSDKLVDYKKYFAEKCGKARFEDMIEDITLLDSRNYTIL